MFGKKKSQNSVPEKKLDVDIQTIPGVFYGGQDPEIYHAAAPAKTPEKKILDTAQPEKKKQQIPTRTTTPASSGLFSHTSTWIVLAGIVIVGGVGISWYYISIFQHAREQVNQQQPTNQTTQVTQVETPVTSTTEQTIPETVTTSTTATTSTEPTTLASVFFDFPPMVTLNTADTDADQLTDIEEELFNTDSGTWDTDEDGYYDGQELINLYNPQGFAPVKIIDSGLVKEYINPAIGYRVYYPTGWQMGSVDVAEKQILFSALSGDYIEMQVVKKDTTDQSFIEWFGRYAEGQRYSDLQSFSNRFSFDGLKRKDGLVAYFDNDQYVVVMLYHPKDSGPVAYRHVMGLMIQSFRMQQTDIDIPDQVIYPGTTTTPENIDTMDMTSSTMASSTAETTTSSTTLDTTQ